VVRAVDPVEFGADRRTMKGTR
jgi:hypothetical protein